MSQLVSYEENEVLEYSPCIQIPNVTYPQWPHLIYLQFPSQT